MNLYGFVSNDGVNKWDYLGMDEGWGTGGGNPHGNSTIQCDGNDGVEVVNNSPYSDKCIKNCVTVHEEQHKNDVLKANPNICKGKAKGTSIAYTNKSIQRATELNGYKAQLECITHCCSHKGSNARAHHNEFLNVMGAIRGLEDLADDAALPPVADHIGGYINPGRKKVEANDLGKILPAFLQEMGEREKKKECGYCKEDEQ